MMTLRLPATEDEALDRLAQASRTRTNVAAATATPARDHPEFVRERTARLLCRYAGLLSRLAEA